MPAIYYVIIDHTKIKDRFQITWKDAKNKTICSIEQEIEFTSEEKQWLWKMPRHRQIVGEKLFAFLDGDDCWFQKALEHANREGKTLLVILRTCKSTDDWPFEVLTKNGRFLTLKDLHLVRYTPALGEVKPVLPKNRPLKVLFMACSAKDVQPELDFEREEDAIFQVTNKLPIDMEVDDSGSLEGLRGKLSREDYDVVHLSGVAGIAKNGSPYFIMEDETGAENRVSPELLWNEALVKNPPRLLILSGDQTAETPAKIEAKLYEAESSFARELVEKYKVSAVLGWGGKVNDVQAIHAGKMLFLELTKGRSLLDALQRARYELSINYPESNKPGWPLLRLYASAIPLNGMVRKEQNWSLKPQQMKHIYLKNSRVKILEAGFVGRRRQLQDSIRGLNAEAGKVGVLLMGTGGLGKSCLAGKIFERFTNHIPIIIHGKFNTITLGQGLKDAFVATQDEKGKKILSQPIEMRDKLAHICTTCFKEKHYLFLLDDFEQNLKGFEKGNPGMLLPESSDLLGVLLHFLLFSKMMSKVIITSRYEFSLSYQGNDIIENRLGKIWLTGFNKTEQWKKLPGLKNIFLLEGHEIVRQLLAAGHGNPRLMEWIDLLVMQLQVNEMESLADAIADKQEEFIQKHVIRELIKKGGKTLEYFLRWFSIYRIPVLEDGAALVAKKARVKDWKTLLRKGMGLSLVEHDRARNSFQVTPLLREELLKGILNHFPCHKAAFDYLKKACKVCKSFDPILSEELIFHALECKNEKVASEKGGELVAYYRDNLAYLEAKRVGEWLLVEKQQPFFTQHDINLLNELGITEKNLGNYHKAIDYYQQALEIFKKESRKPHPDVATSLNNLGVAWDELGDNKKAIDYYKQVFEIDEVVFGNKHPSFAICLNNLGVVYDTLNDFHKSIEYNQKALKILKKIYGEIHPDVANSLNNLGAAFDGLGDFRKAIEYYRKALEIYKTLYGETHPDVGISLNNLGSAWNDLGDQNKAIDYYQQALEIDEAVFGKKHPKVARDLTNLGEAWRILGEPKRAKAYCQKAFEIDVVFFGKQHPQIAIDLNNLALAWDALRDYSKAIDYNQQALEILKAFYGEKHPHVAVSLNNLGSIYDSLGEYFKAIKYYSKALKIFIKAYGKNHPDVAISMNNLGTLWINLGEYHKSIDYCHQALEILRKVYGEIHPDMALALNNLGEAFYGLSDYHKTIDYYLQALDVNEAVFGKQHPEVANDLNNLGMVYFNLNQPQIAAPYFERALDIFHKSLGEDHHYTQDTKDWLKKSRKEEKLIKKF